MEGLIPLLMEPGSLSFYSTMFPTLQWNRIGQSQQRGCRKHLQNFLCPGHLLSVWYPQMSKGHIDRSSATTYASVCPCHHSAAAPKSLRRKHKVKSYSTVGQWRWHLRAWGCNLTTWNLSMSLGKPSSWWIQMNWFSQKRKLEYGVACKTKHMDIYAPC